MAGLSDNVNPDKVVQGTFDLTISEDSVKKILQSTGGALRVKTANGIMYLRLNDTGSIRMLTPLGVKSIL